MNVKAIFFDIDGTLISFYTHKVPESTKKSLNKLREKGVKLFIATGRSPMWLNMIKEMLEFEFDGYIMVNGQYIIADGKTIHKDPIPVEYIEKVIPYLNEKNISCEFVERDFMYLNFINQKVIDLREYLGVTAPTSPIVDLKRIYDHEIFQLCPYITVEEEEDFFKNMPGCRALRWNHMFADIIHEGGGKSVGMKKILDYYGIDVSDTMAFGDGGNDTEMLVFSNIGVAMGNAGEDVKENADFVTKHIDDDGVEFALKYFEVI